MLQLDGEPLQHLTPRAAFERGIVVVHQELALLPTLSVAENVLINSPPVFANAVSPQARPHRSARHAGPRQIERRLALIGAGIDPTARVDGLGQAERQLVEIAPRSRPCGAGDPAGRADLVAAA